MTWQADFEPDGSLRDIYVLDTDVHDWERFVRHLRSTRELVFSVDGQTQTLPESATEVLELRREASPLLRFRIAGVELACHFFHHSEIELDLMPNEVTSQTQVEALGEFMVEIGRLLKREIILTPENWKRSPIYRWDPRVARLEYLGR